MKLADTIRPKTIDDIKGQDHLVGPNGVFRKMLEKGEILSSIIFGPPGTGKTTLAIILAESLNMPYQTFNASRQTKTDLKETIEKAKLFKVMVIIDEFHRLNKDVQDVLLEPLESGMLKIIGTTTENPYFSVNHAIRSRLLVYETKPLDEVALREIFQNAIKKVNPKLKITDEQINYLIIKANYDARTLLNYLEVINLYLDGKNEISQDILRAILGNSQISISNEDNYYLLLSGIQKSIRASDVDAALFYLSRLLIIGDIKVIARRLLTIAYEDIGLANGSLMPRVYAAVNTALQLGLPEARIPLGHIVIEMAISPKSNSGYLAIDKALNLEEDNLTYPAFIDNKKIKAGKVKYNYPHDNYDALVEENYLPKEIKDKVFYIPKENARYEKLLKERLDILDKKRNKKR